MLRLVLISSIFFLYLQLTVSQEIAPYIVGGDEAVANSWPWQLALYRQTEEDMIHLCGAVLIQAKFGLTAAHCVTGGSTIRAYTGSHNLTADDHQETLDVIRRMIHPAYDPGNPRQPNDIAIIEFDRDAILSEKVQPIDLPEEDDEFTGSETCWITGWGITDSGLEGGDRYQPNDVLMERNANVMSNEECNASPTQICVGDLENMDHGACAGDDGSPMSCDVEEEERSWVVAGIFSYGATACEEFPSYYTRITSYLDWIKANVPVV